LVSFTFFRKLNKLKRFEIDAGLDSTVKKNSTSSIQHISSLSIFDSLNLSGSGDTRKYSRSRSLGRPANLYEN
jgi:hypothetical protein